MSLEILQVKISCFLLLFFYLFQRTMVVNDQEDSDFEGSGDTGSGYGDSGESFTKHFNLQ